MTAPAAGAPARHYLEIFPYLVLSASAGTTAGMLRALSPIFAIHLGATTAQMGFMSSLESLGLAVMTLPAGVLVARFGPRLVYVVASLIITLVYCVVPWSHSWIVLACGLGIGGACMPFRIVSVSGSFLERLYLIGQSKAGWYAAAGTIGMLLIGPSLAAFMLHKFGAQAGYFTVSALFACMGIGGTFILSRHGTDSANLTSLTKSFAETGALLRNQVVAAICVIEVSTGMIFAFFSAFIIVTAIKTVGLSESQAISIRMFEGFVAVGTMALGGFIVKKRPLVWFYRASLILIVSGFVMLGAASSYVTLVTATLLLGCGLGTTNLINIIRLSATDAPKSRVSSLQLFSSMGGGFIGGLLGGGLSDIIGLRGMFFSAAVLYALLASRWCFREKLV